MHNWTINSLSHYHAFIQRKIFEHLPLLNIMLDGYTWFCAFYVTNIVHFEV